MSGEQFRHSSGVTMSAASSELFDLGWTSCLTSGAYLYGDETLIKGLSKEIERQKGVIAQLTAGFAPCDCQPGVSVRVVIFLLVVAATVGMGLGRCM